MKLWHAAPGKLIRGHVLDVAVKPFERALQDYDKQLYVAWNPSKLQGHGCWEIRRKPTEKRAIYMGSYQGMNFFKVMRVESRDIHHVLDCAFLNYDALRKIREMDIFRLVEESGYSNLDDLLDAKQKTAAERERAQAEENLRYSIRQNKSAMRDFYEMVRSGIHPAEVLKSTKWVHPQS
jgi:hypothetical protein